jgi:dihydroorotase
MFSLKNKRITNEVCVHHLHFTADDYEKLGTLIQCNPAIKAKENKEALWEALLDDRLDIIATDHAPHTWEEKLKPYGQAPSEKVVEKMCHAPAECFNIEDRGYLREGYWADLVLVDPDEPYTVSKSNILYKCGWSPLEGVTLPASVTHTIVNGDIVFEHGRVNDSIRGMRLKFKTD